MDNFTAKASLLENDEDALSAYFDQQETALDLSIEADDRNTGNPLAEYVVYFSDDHRFFLDWRKAVPRNALIILEEDDFYEYVD